MMLLHLARMNAHKYPDGVYSYPMDGTSYHPGIQLLLAKVTRLGPFWENQSFSAPSWRLYWNLQPGAAAHFQGRSLPLTPDELVLIPPETAFTGEVRRPVSHLHLHFLAGPPYDAVFPALHRFAATGALRQYARELHDRLLATEDSRRCSVLAMALLHAAICHVPDSLLRPAPRDARVVAAMSAMDAHLATPLSNRQLATLVDMSTNAFIRLFTRLAGVTPQQYSTRKRIDHTCMQLHFTDLKLERIAQEAGFCDRYHFSRAFKRLRGVSPGIFRRQSGMVER